MAFCINCGATVQGAFCQQCGTQASTGGGQAVTSQPGAPAATPVMAAPAPGAMGAPAPGAMGAPVKGTISPIVWVLLGVVGLFILGVIVVGTAGVFFVKKVVEKVGQLSFNGPYCESLGITVKYVTERAVFEMRGGKLTLVEIAPGIDLQRDVLAQLDTDVAVAHDLKLMDARVFREESML